MPVYTFRCKKCGQQYEALVKRPGASAPCPACGSPRPEKLMSLFSALFGGSKSRRDRACGPRGKSTGFG